MFDEPSSYLDIKQRLQAARVIRGLLHPGCYVIAVEHDLSVLDYLSDFICCLYGKASVYGVVTMPASVREGKHDKSRRLLLTTSRMFYCLQVSTFSLMDLSRPKICVSETKVYPLK